MGLSLTVLFLRQEKYCIPGILGSCSREGNSEMQSSAMLPVTAISPKLLQITPFENMAQCKCETKRKKKGGKKEREKKKRRKEKINNKRERNKKEKEKRKIKALQASGFNLFGFFHYLFTCFFPPLIIPLQSSQTCWTSMLVAQEQSWAVMLCSEYV